MSSPTRSSLLTLLSGLLLLLTALSPVCSQNDALNAELATYCSSSAATRVSTCALLSVCKEKGITPSWCNSLSLIKTLRDVEVGLGDESVVKSYNTYCQENAIQCKLYDSIPNQVSSSVYQADIRKMCSNHHMDDCKSCTFSADINDKTPVSALANCDTLKVYSNLCRKMPGMSKCDDWKNLCKGIQNTSPFVPELCVAISKGGNNSTSGRWDIKPTPQMIMYFHQSILEYLLFESWVTYTAGLYTLAWFGIFFFTIGFYAFQTYRTGILGPRLVRNVDDAQTTVARELWHAIRASLLAVDVMWGFIIMLIIMTYNIGWFFSVIAGAFFGNYIFARRLLIMAPRRLSSSIDNVASSGLYNTNSDQYLNERPDEPKAPCC